MSKPVLSIVIATYNSQKLLTLCLNSIKRQDFPTAQREILVMDGGSTDETRTIAKEFGCRVIDNPQKEPVHAKLLGLRHAKGKYIMYLDSDEVLLNPRSLTQKVQAFRLDHRVKAVVGSGYVSPPSYPFLNTYINEFGDPFSFFIYRMSKDARFFQTQMKHRYRVKKESKHHLIFEFSDQEVLPLIELVAMGGVTDLKYLVEQAPQTLTHRSFIPHLFYFLVASKQRLAFVKDDPIEHYSAETFSKYLKKIAWRVKNNIYHVSELGMSGYTGRQQYLPWWSRMKKFFYIPYVFLLLPLALDTVWLIVSRRDLRYSIHVPLSMYTAGSIVYHLIIKAGGGSEGIKSYGS